jgi:hypothetical protein
MKNIILLVIILLLSSLSILYSKPIELHLIQLNWSWTIAKLTPYLFYIVEGLMLFFIFKKTLKLSNYLKLIILVLAFVLPFLIGFIFNPIYEGAFSKQGITSFKAASKKDMQGVDLVVITIPECRFCRESTIYCNLMLKRNPNLKIRYIVCTKDTNQIQPYQDKLDKKIDVALAEDPNQAAKTAGGSFPAFLLIKNNKAIQKWSNDQFGVRAKDLVEASAKE